MAKAVHDELASILVEHGGYDKMGAIMELNKWAQEKRYLRDLVRPRARSAKLINKCFLLFFNDRLTHSSPLSP